MLEKRRITIKDVARHAGVSPGAVSRVLHGKTSTIRVSEITAELIRKAATDLDYRPNAVAQSLRSGKTHLLALASQGELALLGKNAFLIERLVCEADRFGYSVILSSKFFGANIDGEALRGNFDALIWLGQKEEIISQDLLSTIRVPIVCLNSNPSAWPDSTRHWFGDIHQLPFQEVLSSLVSEKIAV